MFDNDDDDANDTIKRMMRDMGMAPAEGPDTQQELTQEQQIEMLTSLTASIDEKYTFGAGQLVTWKEKLNIMRSTGPFIFRRYLAEPMKFEKDPASMFFCEEADAIVAALVVSNSSNNLTLAEWAVPSRRLRPLYDAATLS